MEMASSMIELEQDAQLLRCLAEGDTYLPSAVSELNSYFCGCGDPESAWRWIHDYLDACTLDVWDRVETGTEYIAAYLLHRLGYTEHGTSVRCSWLTEKGIILFAFLCRWGANWDNDRRWIDSEGVSHGSF